MSKTLREEYKMNIRFIGIDGLGEHEVNRIFLPLKDFDFIKDVNIRKVQDVIFHNSWGEVLDIYDVTIEIEPVYRDDDVSIHIFDNSVYIVDFSCRHDEAIIYIDRSAYERVEII